MAPETLLHAVWPALLLGVVLALGLERLLAPAMVLPWRRPPATLALHAGLWLTFQGGLLLLLGRWWSWDKSIWLLKGVNLIFSTQLRPITQ